MTHNGEKHHQETGRTPTLLMTLMQLTNVLIQSREYRDAFAVSAETQTCQQSMLTLSPMQARPIGKCLSLSLPECMLVIRAGSMVGHRESGKKFPMGEKDQDHLPEN